MLFVDFTEVTYVRSKFCYFFVLAYSDYIFVKIISSTERLLIYDDACFVDCLEQILPCFRFTGFQLICLTW